MMLPPELVDRVREATDIAAVVSRYVTLRRAGRTLKALCPFHQEKTPSFTVNPDRQIFKCFGCGEGGDVFRFLMAHEKMSFPEAVEVLATEAGIPLPRKTWTGPEEESVYPVLEWAAGWYRRELQGSKGEEARGYLAGRGIAPATIERFGLGFSPSGWSNLLGAAQGRYTPRVLVRAGLLLEGDRGPYDRFRNRLMIPIRSALGRTIGFGARALGPEEPKYLNSPETEVFHKSRILYGLPESREGFREAEEAIVVEGYMDAMALSQFGFGNVVASCGTAFTEDQARLLRRYVERALLLFDGDAAGLRAAWKSAGVFLGAGLGVRIVVLPDEHDPDSFVREKGPEALRALLTAAPGVVGFARQHLLERVERREDLLQAFAELGARIDDPIRRQVLLQEASEAFRFDEGTLREAAARRRPGAAAPAAPRAPVQPPARDRLGRIYLARLWSTEAVEEQYLLPASVFREKRLQELYERWLALRDQGERRPLHRLLEEEAFRSETAEILAEGEDQTPLPAAAARLWERVAKAKGQALREAIQEAEARGDGDSVNRLLRELQALKEQQAQPLAGESRD